MFIGTRIDHCTEYRIAYSCYPHYRDAPHTVISCSHITVTSAHCTSVHACIVAIFSSSLSILHVLLFHVTVFMLYDCSMLLYSCYMIVSCHWYGYSRYWTWELLIRDMWNPTSIVPVSCYIVPVILFPFPVILFYAINRAQVQLSCYPYHVFVLVTLYTWHIRS